MIPSFSRSIGYVEALHLLQARSIRFAAMGVVTFVINVSLLALFTAAGMGPVLAYAVALALAVQFNFASSQIWVWRDRRLGSLWGRAMVERWATFHACIAVSLVVNLSVFAAAQLVMPVILAVVAGVLASTLLKFISMDRLAFKAPGTNSPAAGIDQTL